MENHIIIKEDGSRLLWKNNRLNKKFCLLYHDNNQKYIFTPQSNLKCKLFMIGGGGAGGYYFGGGGGAGAAYINNNFTFEQGKTYTFSIGTGGTCDIKDFDNLFNSGLSLKVYNNTSPNLNNISFNFDDYSSLGINSTEIIQSFIVNNITINTSIFNSNTTYIWDGYIKSTIKKEDTNKIVSVRFNSKIKTFMWFNTYTYTTTNALIATSGETNIQEVKVLQLDPNKFYNVKIIAYNFDTSNNSNFNIDFVNCELFNYNKTYENYNVVPATETTLTFKTVSTNENSVISCKGGGTGGFGLYNQNENLNGGCGGGSGINKVKGVSTNNNPIYNGTDGAVGNYCGGGGGIMSSGNNNRGGDGKIINWFDQSLLFGAGGNGANYKDERKLGYGCGGNGGDCCYFSKSIINNNGNNGCILIYADDSNDITEHFVDITNRLPDVSAITKTTNYLRDNPLAIASKLIDESFLITSNSSNYVDAITSNDRNTYFTKSLSFGNLAVDDSNLASPAPLDHNNMNNFIYDVLVISKIYAVSYRLLYHHYKVNCGGDITKFATFMDTAKIQFTQNNASNVNSEITFSSENNDSNIIKLNNVFLIDNLGLHESKIQNDYAAINSIYIGADGANSSSGCPNIKKDVFQASIEDICGTNGDGYHVPAYHNVSTGAFIKGFKLFKDNTTTTNPYDKNINKITATTGSTTSSNTYEKDNTGSSNIDIEFNQYSINYLTRTSLINLYTYYSNDISTTPANITTYENTRILLYLEAFNNILNTNSYTSLLPTLKYNMFYYNSIIYNVIIQYEIFNYQSLRVALNTSNRGTAFFAIPSTTSHPVYSDIATFMAALRTNFDIDTGILKNNLDQIILKNINTPDNVTTTINEIVTIINTNNQTDNTFIKNQQKLNDMITKYNSEFDKNNNLLYYYKIIIIIALFLILVIFVIFSIPSLDNNTKIGIYVLIIFIVIILLIYYNNYFIITENFVTTYKKAETTTVYSESGSRTLSYNQYKVSLIDYLTKITKIMANATINKDMLFPIKSFSDKADDVRRNKAEYYKLKAINLESSIEILKKSTNDYYYYIILIVISTIILLFSLILLLLNPEMLIQVVALAAIFVIILVYYISYKLNKSTRLAENKNYWANYNPSKSTLDGL